MPTSQVSNPQARDGSWVTDEARLLQPATVRAINLLCSQAAKTPEHPQVAVVLIRTTDGKPVKAYATELFNLWGIGQAPRCNGVLMLVARNERRTEIEVGRGLAATLPDDAVSEILSGQLTPAFRRGDFDRGCLDAVAALCLRLTASIPPRSAERPDLATSSGAPRRPATSAIAPHPGTRSASPGELQDEPTGWLAFLRLPWLLSALCTYLFWTRYRAWWFFKILAILLCFAAGALLALSVQAAWPAAENPPMSLLPFAVMAWLGTYIPPWPTRRLDSSTSSPTWGGWRARQSRRRKSAQSRPDSAPGIEGSIGTWEEPDDMPQGATDWSLAPEGYDSTSSSISTWETSSETSSSRSSSFGGGQSDGGGAGESW